MAKKIIGIDPGKSGGFACIDLQENRVAIAKMPSTELDIFETLEEMAENGETTVYLEKVNAGPSMGSSAAFKFGHNCGLLHAYCLALKTRLVFVSPHKWQKRLSLITKGRGLGQDDTAKKNRNKARAQELFPGVKITHHVADALLIAEYGRQVVHEEAS